MTIPKASPAQINARNRNSAKWLIIGAVKGLSTLKSNKVLTSQECYKVTETVSQLKEILEKWEKSSGILGIGLNRQLGGLEELRKSALESTSARDHEIQWEPPYHGERNSWQTGTCCKCGEWVQINTNPSPYQIDIGGPAVAVNCRASEELL